MNKGIAVIYDPHNVYQFLWYYTTFGKNLEWYALCLPNSYKGEYLSETCIKTGIFKKVYRDTNPFDAMPIRKRFYLFIKMFFYALIGRQKTFSKQFISRYIDNLEFDTAVVLTDVGFISGLFLTLAPEKTIIILEDGMGDYNDRKYSNIFGHMHNFFDIQGFLLSVLGYSNIGHYYPLRTTKNCIKYCSHPDKMLYKNYKEMGILFDMTKTDIKLFNNLVKVIYPNIEKYFEGGKKDVIIFTTPLNDYTPHTDKYIRKIQKYVKTHFNSVILKKHPRDTSVYDFGAAVTLTEIDSHIPSEVLLSYLKEIKIVFFEHSSTNLYMHSLGYNPAFFYFAELADECLKQQVFGRYAPFTEFRDRLTFFEIENSIIIKL